MKSVKIATVLAALSLLMAHCRSNTDYSAKRLRAQKPETIENSNQLNESNDSDQKSKEISKNIEESDDYDFVMGVGAWDPSVSYNEARNSSGGHHLIGNVLIGILKKNQVYCESNNNENSSGSTVDTKCRIDQFHCQHSGIDEIDCEAIDYKSEKNISFDKQSSQVIFDILAANGLGNVRGCRWDQTYAMQAATILVSELGGGGQGWGFHDASVKIKCRR